MNEWRAYSLLDRTPASLGGGKDVFYITLCPEGLEIKAPTTKESPTFDPLQDPSIIPYRAGDSLSILPEEDPTLINQVLEKLGCDGSEHISHPSNGETLSLHKLLRYHVHLPRDPAPIGKISLTEQARQWIPQLPRLYSIASSPYEHVHKMQFKMQLLVRRTGICSTMLCSHLMIGQKIWAKIQPARRFHPLLNRPMFLIAQGTGIAPYRSFLASYLVSSDLPPPAKPHWLLFGDRSPDYFYYRPFFEQLQERDIIKLRCAFSRVSPHQRLPELLHEHVDTLYEVMQQGGNIFLSGDVLSMKKDLFRILRGAIERHNPLEEAASLWKAWKQRIHMEIYS